MAKPNGSIKQISSSVDNETYEIIPHRLTDGANVVSLPTIDDDKTLVVSNDDMVIPTVPSEGGVYCMAFTVESGSKTLSWQPLIDVTTYIPEDDPTAAPRMVLADENRGAMNVVYYVVESEPSNE